MKVINDFYCSVCDEVRERYVDSAATAVECHCGANMVKKMSTPRIRLDGTDPAFPSAYDNWARVREQNNRIVAKRNRE